MLARAAIFVGLLVTPIFAHAAEEIDFGRYHARVIGNDKYQHLQPPKPEVTGSNPVGCATPSSAGARASAGAPGPVLTPRRAPPTSARLESP